LLETNFKQLEENIKQIASSSFLSKKGINNTLTTAWENAVDKAFDDGVLTEQEETSLNKFKEYFSLSQDLLDRNGALTKVVKGAVLRDVLNGKLPERMQVEGNLPFNLQKEEKVIWAFQNVDYYEQKTRTRYVGGSQGVSIRVARGVYYRACAFKGERVQSSETVHAGTGLMGITNKHIYFSSSSKSFRIAFNKIVTFEPFSDGIGVQRDTSTAKPQTFVTGDGWFTYNLVANLAQL